MHYPPFRTGIRWVDAVGLHGGRKMAAMVARHRQVQRVACGHAHRPIQAAWAGTIAATAPSTSQYRIEPRAVQLYLQDPEYGILSHVGCVSGVGENLRIRPGVALP